MSRKTDRKSTSESPIQSRQQQLAQQEQQVKVRLNQTREFLQQVPALKDEVKKKQQRELIDRFNHPARLEGPTDFRLNFDRGRTSAPPRKLRKERSKAPLVTLLLLVTFVIVAYYAWKALWQG
jgi:hypothetical protein